MIETPEDPHEALTYLKHRIRLGRRSRHYGGALEGSHTNAMLGKARYACCGGAAAASQRVLSPNSEARDFNRE